MQARPARSIGSLRAYRRSGVREYLALQVYERRADWFALRDGVNQRQPPADAGVLRSRMLPCQWLQSEPIWTSDLARLMAVLQQGLASPEQAEFAVQLREAR